jgi:hypothetical protein
MALSLAAMLSSCGHTAANTAPASTSSIRGVVTSPSGKSFRDCAKEQGGLLVDKCSKTGPANP